MLCILTFFISFFKSMSWIREPDMGLKSSQGFHAPIVAIRILQAHILLCALDKIVACSCCLILCIDYLVPQMKHSVLVTIKFSIVVVVIDLIVTLDLVN